MDRADLEQWKAREVARLLALVETERRYYQEIVASIPVGLLVLSADLAVVSSNRAVKRIFGLRGSASVRSRLDALLPEWVLERVRDVLGTGVPQTDLFVETGHPTAKRLRIAILAIRNWEDEDEQEALLAIEDLTNLEAPAAPPAPIAIVVPEEPAPAVEQAQAEPPGLAEEAEAPAPEEHTHAPAPAEQAEEAPAEAGPETAEAVVVVEVTEQLEITETVPEAAPEAIEEQLEPEIEPEPIEPEIGFPAPELIANLDAIVWAVEVPNMEFLFVSPQAESILGYPVEHWMDSPNFWLRRIHESDRAAIAESYDRLLQDPSQFEDRMSCEYRALTSAGQVRWLRESTRVLATDEGRARFLIGMAFDITERRQLEDQLVQSQRVEAVGKLASRMAHDLNNMLMIVTGYGEELLHGLPNASPSRADVQEIIAATERLAGLTQQLLAFTRKPAQAAEAVDLKAVMDVLEAELRELLGDRIELEIEPTVEPVAVTADAGQLAQVISAFAHHAREAMPDGGALTIEISRTVIEEELRRPELPLRPAAYGVITLKDTASHSDGEAHAFFETLPPKDALEDASRSLSRAYSVVRQWGGDVVVANGPIRGTLFRIYLPLIETAHEAPPEPIHIVEEPEPEPPPPPAPEPQLETILVVEDEAGIRALVRKILRRQGYNVIEATGAEEALRMCRDLAGKVDLLITDVVMPDIDGRELVRQLKEECKQMRVIYVSGYTDDSELYGELPPGTAFLQKPFTLGALLDKVKEVLATKID